MIRSLAFAALVAAAALAQEQGTQHPAGPGDRPLGATGRMQGDDATHGQSPTTNNAANRAANTPTTPAEQFEALPGGPATPKSQWTTGDQRGQAQARKKRSARRRSTRPNKTEQKTPPRESAGGER